MLDASRTRQEILDAYQNVFGHRLRGRDLSDFCEELSRNGLLGGGPAPEAMAPRHHKSPPPEPFSWRDTGAPLNAGLDILVLIGGFLISPLMAPPILVLAAAAAWGLCANFADYEAYLARLAGDFELPLLIWILLLKLLFVDLPRALATGVACRMHGGRVQGIRIHLLRGVLPYISCEAGEALHAMDDRGRMKVLWARQYTLLAITSVAVLGFFMAQSGPLKDFFALLTIPTLVGLFLQFMVVLPFDGHLILTHAAGIPELHERARAETWAWLTFRRSPRALSSGERAFFRLYGVLSFVLQWGLTLAAAGLVMWRLTSRFDGAGGILGTGLLLAWFRVDLRRAIVSNRAGRFIVRAGGAWYIRWPLRIIIICAIIWVATRPYPRTVGGTVRVVPAAQMGVRAQLNDEIIDIKVREGDLVQAGDEIATLSGREIRSSIQTTEASLRQARAALDELVNGPLPIELSILQHEVDENKVQLDFYNLEVTRLEKLVKESVSNQRELDQRRADRDSTKERLANAQQRLERLRIGTREESIAAQRAETERLQALLDYYHIQEGLLVLRSPITGRVATPHVRNRVGQRVTEGDLVCVIQSEELAIEMEADEAAAAEVREGMPVELRFRGLEEASLPGKVASLSHTIETEDEKEDASIRTDPERLIQRTRVNTRPAPEDYYIRATITLDDMPEALTRGMTGYGKIKVGESVVWRSFLEPVTRFFKLEVWSWVP